MSETLSAIMKHWTGEFPPPVGVETLPFNIELFCAENDRRIAALTIAEEALDNTAWQECLAINADEMRAFKICGDIARDALARMRALRGEKVK